MSEIKDKSWVKAVGVTLLLSILITLGIHLTLPAAAAPEPTIEAEGCVYTVPCSHVEIVVTAIPDYKGG